MKNRNSGVFSARTLNLAVILFILSMNSVFAQAPTVEWSKCLGGTDFDAALSIEQTTDGGYIVAGTSYSSDGDIPVNYGWQDYWIAKLDLNGNLVWQKTLGGTIFDYATSIRQTLDGGYIVAGTAFSNDGDVVGKHSVDTPDVWIVKLDNIGTIQWQKCLGGTDSEYLTSLELTTDGGYIITAESYSFDGDVSGHIGLVVGSSDGWVVKLDASGTVEWEKSLGGIDMDGVYSVKQTDDLGYIVAGWSNSNDVFLSGNHGYTDYWIAKLDSLGVMKWQKCFGGTQDEIVRSIEQAIDGGYIVAGWSRSNDGDVTNNKGEDDYWIVKLDSIGNIEWEKSLGGSSGDAPYMIRKTTDGGYVVVGWAGSNDGDVIQSIGYMCGWIVKLSLGGNIEWQKCLNGTDYDWLLDIKQTADGGFISTGCAFSSDGYATGSQGNGDFWIIKLSPESAPLPIELLTFNAQMSKENTVHVKWATSSQSNNNYFEVERSADGKKWTSVERVKGCGTCYDTKDYLVSDLAPIFGQSYYRLKQVDYDGRFNYSDIVVVTVGAFSRIAVSNNSLGWTISGLSKNSRIVIYDFLGMIILEESVSNSFFNVDNSDYPEGCYIINVVSGNMVFSAKVVK